MILPTWAVLHLLFFHLLKVPLQLECFINKIRGPRSQDSGS